MSGNEKWCLGWFMCVLWFFTDGLLFTICLLWLHNFPNIRFKVWFLLSKIYVLLIRGHLLGYFFPFFSMCLCMNQLFKNFIGWQMGGSLEGVCVCMCLNRPSPMIPLSLLLCPAKPLISNSLYALTSLTSSFLGEASRSETQITKSLSACLGKEPQE